MDNWLKALIAMACIVVIGWGGYLGVMEYQRRADIARAIQIERDLATIRTAQAKKAAEQAAADKEKWAVIARNAECHKVANDMRTYEVFDSPKNVAPKDDLAAQIKRCAADGKLSNDDLADMKPYLAN